MQNEICALFHVEIVPSQFDALRALVDTLVKATAGEPGAIGYEWVVNPDHTEVHIIERYRTECVLPHIEQTFAPYAAEFLKLAKIKQLTVYGDPTPEIRATLDGFGAVYLAPFAGFRR
jgi:quinol monooxygenase YgiN